MGILDLLHKHGVKLKSLDEDSTRELFKSLSDEEVDRILEDLQQEIDANQELSKSLGFAINLAKFVLKHRSLITGIL